MTVRFNPRKLSLAGDFLAGGIGAVAAGPIGACLMVAAKHGLEYGTRRAIENAVKPEPKAKWKHKGKKADKVRATDDGVIDGEYTVIDAEAADDSEWFPDYSDMRPNPNPTAA